MKDSHEKLVCDLLSALRFVVNKPVPDEPLHLRLHIAGLIAVCHSAVTDAENRLKGVKS